RQNQAMAIVKLRQMTSIKDYAIYLDNPTQGLKKLDEFSTIQDSNAEIYKSVRIIRGNKRKEKKERVSKTIPIIETKLVENHEEESETAITVSPLAHLNLKKTSSVVSDPTNKPKAYVKKARIAKSMPSQGSSLS
ncbi:MAG: hypothetical protein PUB18_03835, partial [bacterium]|nr:hypothetical protein [bacterium]